MNTPPYSIQAKVWLYKGKGAWHFATIEKKDADEIRNEYIWPRKGFGSIPVYATIGNTRWKTSIFPDKNGTYVLPLKKEVRSSEKIAKDDVVVISIEVIT